GDRSIGRHLVRAARPRAGRPDRDAARPHAVAGAAHRGECRGAGAQRAHGGDREARRAAARAAPLGELLAGGAAHAGRRGRGPLCLGLGPESRHDDGARHRRGRRRRQAPAPAGTDRRALARRREADAGPRPTGAAAARTGSGEAGRGCRRRGRLAHRRAGRRRRDPGRARGGRGGAAARAPRTVGRARKEDGAPQEIRGRRRRGVAAQEGGRRRRARDHRRGRGRSAAAGPGIVTALAQEAGAAAAQARRRSRQADGGRGPARGDGRPAHHQRAGGRGGEDEGARPRAHADRPPLQDRQHVRDRAGQARLRAGHAQGGDPQHGRSQDRRGAPEVAPAAEAGDQAHLLPPASMKLGRGLGGWDVTAPPALCAALAVLAAAVVPARRARGESDVEALRAAALAAIAKARAAARTEVLREVTLPSIERLVEDADLRRASVTKPARDNAFVRDTLATARSYAERVAKGDDPYRTATGELVKAYRAAWDGTLQPYALYVPRRYDGYDKKTAWPLIVALHG